MLDQGVYFFLRKFTVFNRGFKVLITSNAFYVGADHQPSALDSVCLSGGILF